MSLGERRERWTSMMDVLEKHTVNDWWKNFVAALSTAEPAPVAEMAGDLGATG